MISGCSLRATPFRSTFGSNQVSPRSQLPQTVLERLEEACGPGEGIRGEGTRCFFAPRKRRREDKQEDIEAQHEAYFGVEPKKRDQLARVEERRHNPEC
jgi:hypothetical protein